MGQVPTTKEKISTALVIVLVISVVIIIVLFTFSSVAGIYIQDVYVPALDISTSNGTTPFNTSVLVDLKYKRWLAVVGMDYEDRELVLLYGHSITPVAGYLVRAFGMGHHITVHKMAAMEAPQLPWDKAFRAVSSGSTVELVVKLGRIHRYPTEDVLAANVAVGASGHMVSKGPIKLVENG